LILQLIRDKQKLHDRQQKINKYMPLHCFEKGTPSEVEEAIWNAKFASLLKVQTIEILITNPWH
jgi:hypothetical protein